MEVVHQEEHQAGGEEAKEDIGDPEEPDRTEGIIIIHWENRSQRLRESNRDQVTVFSIGERDSFFPSQGGRGHESLSLQAWRSRDIAIPGIEVVETEPLGLGDVEDFILLVFQGFI